MSHESSFLINSKNGRSSSNCFVDSDGFVNATAHAVLGNGIRPPTNLSNAYIVFHDNYPYQVPFGVHPILDYATSLQPLPDEYLPEHALQYAEEIPENRVNVTIYARDLSNKRQKRIHTTGIADVISLQGYGTVLRMEVRSKNIFAGDSGALVTLDRSGVFGRFHIRGSEKRILGAVVAIEGDPLFSPGIGYVEFSPRVHNGEMNDR